MMQNWVNGILGLVVLAVAFMGISGATLTWILAISGAVIAAISFWNLSMSDVDQAQRTHGHGHA